MSDLFQQLAKEESFIEIGEVEETVGKNKYSVTVRGKKSVLLSTVDKALQIGELVVINRTSKESYIIGTTNKKKSHVKKEIIVNG